MPITPQELISNLGDLPPLPQVAAQVLRLAADPDSTTDELQRVTATDQALASQILKIANSAMFGLVREVRTLTQAIMTLGFSTIKSIVIASSARNLYKRGGSSLQERLLWEHALITAIASRAYAKAFRSPRVEEAFLGGQHQGHVDGVGQSSIPEHTTVQVAAIFLHGSAQVLEHMRTGNMYFDIIGQVALVLSAKQVAVLAVPDLIIQKDLVGAACQWIIVDTVVKE